MGSMSRFLLVLLLSLLVPGPVALAATHVVGIGDDCEDICFYPSPLVIQAGDTVKFFVYYSNSFHGDHNVVADDGSFRCARGCDGEGGNGSPSSEWSFTRIFDRPGRFAYHDEVAKAKGVLVIQDAGAPAPIVTAYEYVYGLPEGRLPVSSYFVTWDPAEIATFGFLGPWRGTLETFLVWKDAASGALPTCRFLDRQFGGHFFSPHAGECAALGQQPRWLYEGIAFYLKLPDDSGNCQAGTTALYRLYNQSAHAPPRFRNAKPDVPLHRYTISLATVDRMRAAGWITEGDERTGAFACVPY